MLFLSSVTNPINWNLIRHGRNAIYNRSKENFYTWSTLQNIESGVEASRIAWHIIGCCCHPRCSSVACMSTGHLPTHFYAQVCVNAVMGSLKFNGKCYVPYLKPPPSFFFSFTIFISFSLSLLPSIVIFHSFQLSYRPVFTIVSLSPSFNTFVPSSPCIIFPTYLFHNFNIFRRYKKLTYYSPKHKSETIFR